MLNKKTSVYKSERLHYQNHTHVLYRLRNEKEPNNKKSIICSCSDEKATKCGVTSICTLANIICVSTDLTVKKSYKMLHIYIYTD